MQKDIGFGRSLLEVASSRLAGASHVPHSSCELWAILTVNYHSS